MNCHTEVLFNGSTVLAYAKTKTGFEALRDVCGISGTKDPVRLPMLKPLPTREAISSLNERNKLIVTFLSSHPVSPVFTSMEQH